MNSPPPQLTPTRLQAALHVTNGDSTGGTLAHTGWAERILPWRDVLHEGPVPDLPEPQLRRVRAEFLAGDDAAEAEEIGRWLEWRDEELAGNRGGEYVLWFEADLYDQLQIAQVLARLADLEVPPDRITLICIGEHLSIARFKGLGELDHEQLAALPAAAAIQLTPAALELASRAWAALRAPDPSGLEEISSSPELRFLGEAFDRLAREYPSTRDGLSLTERRLLAAVGEGRSAAEAFVKAGAREARPFLGDLFAYRILSRFLAAPVPLLHSESGTAVEARTQLRLTQAGERVLRGEEDHAALNGVERWVGGVRLAGREPRWRWDEGTESIRSVQ